MARLFCLLIVSIKESKACSEVVTAQNACMNCVQIGSLHSGCLVCMQCRDYCMPSRKCTECIYAGSVQDAISNKVDDASCRMQSIPPDCVIMLCSAACCTCAQHKRQQSKYTRQKYIPLSSLPSQTSILVDTSRSYDWEVRPENLFCPVGFIKMYLRWRQPSVHRCVDFYEQEKVIQIGRCANTCLSLVAKVQAFAGTLF